MGSHGRNEAGFGMTTSLILLTPDTEATLQDIDETDLLVGIPSYSNATTIGYVVRAVGAGLAKYFP